MNKSIATIDSPEFINLQTCDLNPLMSSCEIKVCYVGENRNQSYFDKETLINISKTLRGAPIVGYYKEEQEDFRDHGYSVVIEENEIKFICKTKPYGFVAPDAKVWFQKFEDYDDFGNINIREYLMTTGYLWTGQFPECQSVVSEDGKPQSMELDEKTVQGHWAKNNKSGIEFFIINDAIFSKLCILGDDVEPCFEGASITAPEVSKNFTKMDTEFKETLYSMMQDLQKLTFALKGGKTMDGIDESALVNEQTDTTSITEDPNIDFKKKPEEEEKEVENNKSNEDTTEEENDEEKKKVVTSVCKTDDDEDEKKKASTSVCKTDDEDEEKKKYSKLEEEYNLLNNNYSKLQEDFNRILSENETLKEFKLNIENKEKDDMINSFYMLSDEDKADVITNKSKYTLEEIESKLSVICVRKKVNFNMDSTESNISKTKEDITLFNLNNVENNTTPAWIQACENRKRNRK